jgi:calcineurin-like phosphoesterase
VKLLFLGDTVGRSGRSAICRLLPEIRSRLVRWKW